MLLPGPGEEKSRSSDGDIGGLVPDARALAGTPCLIC